MQDVSTFTKNKLSCSPDTPPKNTKRFSNLQSKISRNGHHFSQFFFCLFFVFSVNAGLPQGSIPGHTLFLLCINDLPNDFICNIVICVDDTLITLVLVM